MVRLEGLGALKNINDSIGSRTRDLPACIMATDSARPFLYSCNWSLSWIYDRQTAGQSGSHLDPMGSHGQTSSVFWLTTAGFLMWSALSVERTGLLITVQLLLGLTSAVLLGSESRWTKTLFHFPSFWDSPNLEGQVPVYVSPRNKVAQLYPRVPFPHLLWLEGYDASSRL
jgi:hypothetical protein